MQQIIHDLKTYLIENHADKRDFLMTHPVSLSKPVVKKTAPVVKSAPPLPKMQAKVPAPQKIAEEPIEEELPAPSYLSEKPQASSQSIDTEMMEIYKKIAPQVKISESPPKDDVAKQIRLASNKRSDLPEIPVLFDHTIQEHLEFLTNLAKAINASFGTSSIINIHEFEEKNLWKPLLAHSQIRLIIIPSSLLKHSPNLHHLTKEYPGRLLKSVEKIPLLALSEISDSPVRKKEIWGILSRFFTKK